MDVCTACFAAGKYPTHMTSADFVKIDTTLDDLRDEWTDQETLLLLEGIEMFGDSWNDIAEHIGTKTVQQCVLHFLRLPIEVRVTSSNVGTTMRARHGKSFILTVVTCALYIPQDPYLEDQLARFVGVGPKSTMVEEPHPFAAAANPLMTMIAFLSSSVDPRGSSINLLSDCVRAELSQFLSDDLALSRSFFLQSRRLRHMPRWR
jgi:SWI/SNF related-matrix-associated actin-dependent regulator of chromatin subfamily C